MAEASTTSGRTRRNATTIVTGVAITLAMVGVALLLTLSARLLLLLFAGLLLGILFRGLADLLRRVVPLPSAAALGLVVLLLVALLVLAGLLLGPSIVAQADEIQDRVPRAVEDIQGWLRQFGLGRRLLGEQPIERALDGGEIAQRATSLLGNLLSFGGALLIVLFTGLFWAAEPELYRRGTLRLVPPRHRERVAAVLGELDDEMRRWLVAKALSMVIVGTLAGVGLGLVGVPLALTLGILTGLLDFVPYIGPILSAAPGVLIALTVSPRLALVAAGTYLIVQLLESYVVTPLIERTTLKLAPAYTLGLQVLLGLFTGAIGVALASPFGLVLLVLVQRFYVEDALGDSMAKPLP